jgi:hypothetical protein
MLKGKAGLLFAAIFIMFFMSGNSAILFAQVQQEWLSQFNGPAGSEDSGKDIAVDASGNVYIAGYANVNGTRGTDCLLLKYDAQGSLLWSRLYDSPDHSTDRGQYVAIDNEANIYVAGTSDHDQAINNFFILKYNPDSVLQWTANYQMPQRMETRLAGMALDQEGNIFICGGVPNLSIPNDFDFVTVKYDSQGEFKWEARYFGEDSNWTVATGLAVDAAGNAYVTGRNEDADARFRYTTIKYNALGLEQWAAIYSNPDNNSYGNMPVAIGLDYNNNVYVTGLLSYIDETCKYQTIKYNNSGILQWVELFTPDSSRLIDAVPTFPYAMAVDSVGNVFVTGNGYWGHEVMATVAYNTNGVQKWSAFYGGYSAYYNQPFDIACDKHGNAYVTGATYDTINFTCDYITIKYGLNGDQEWTQRYASPQYGYDTPYAIAIDSSDNVFVTGISKGDVVTIKYSQSQVGIDDSPPAIPQTITLEPAYPNPFNSRTVLSFNLPTEATAKVEVYDISGRLAGVLADKKFAAGNHTITWDASGFASGVYFVKLSAEGISQVKKAVLIK